MAFSKINHVAIVSENYAQLSKFYEAVFGMRTSPRTRPARAVTVGDGYVGLNINPRRAGRSAGLDHFGIQVEDTEAVYERMRKRYPNVKWLKRPSTRPFAGVSTHDPDGNMFDISQKFGTKIKVVSGYKGGNDVYLAMERGEVSGRCGGLISSIRSTRPDWFPEKKVEVPIQIAFKRSRHLPDVPALAEVVKDEQKLKVLRLILAPQEMDRLLLAPPGVPAERVAILRKAFDAAVADPAFRAEAKRQSLEVDPVSGEEVAQTVREAYALPKDIVAAAKNAMKAPGK